jgi:hypothetical protein
METPIEVKTPRKLRRDRQPVQLPVNPAVYKRLRARAKKERYAFGHWLARLALRELRRKPSL